ncbi:hypothetical protein EYF80_008909 [Liparis tanakae]|uniref:Uncharacterized protein n=1 Tax=Liparis tanakae TaxID=230148 RepID=A0A4Z2ITN7_9TELE|nr:hypothetical protein EYF80_008909 [Liparis tanakae]
MAGRDDPYLLSDSSNDIDTVIQRIVRGKRKGGRGRRMVHKKGGGGGVKAKSDPAQLPGLSSTPSVFGKLQRSPRWERCVSLAGSLPQGLGAPLVPPAPCPAPTPAR